MAEMDLGYFCDERLKKTALSCFIAFASGRRFVCAGSQMIAPKRSSSNDS